MKQLSSFSGSSTTEQEVIESSIKRNKSGPGIVSIYFPQDGFTARNVTLQMLIRSAYDVEENQISGGPKWFDRDSFNVQAKVDGSVIDEWRKLTENQRRAEQQPMLQALLAERFKLVLHRETKELAVYGLTIAKKGPKLPEAKPGDTYPGGLTGLDGQGAPNLLRVGRGVIIGQAVSIGSFVHALTTELDRPVLDKTGLKGIYDFKLEWAPESQGTIWSRAGSESGTEAPPLLESSGPSIFAAIQEQLGLKLESQKGPVEILVIDHIERPSEN